MASTPDTAADPPLASAPLADVAETARWVATYRAWESARPDALFHDPYAARLAGDRGEAIARTMAQPGAAGNGWPMITRTVIMDELVLACVAAGCTTVLNLGAGYDTRPYRLALPEALTWIEVDRPAVLEEKTRILDGEPTRRHLERVGADLADPARRAEVLDDVDARSARTLVLTEGVLIYLDAGAARDLGTDLLARPHVTDWVLDLVSPPMLGMLRRNRETELARAPMTFGPADGAGFFEKLGWRMREARSLFHEGVRLRRVPWPLRPFAWMPPPDPRAPGRKQWAAVVHLERPGAGGTRP